MGDTIAAIRIRGVHDTDYNVGRALKSLRLLRKHACVLIEDTPSIRGQLAKAKDYVTWGKIDDETKNLLISKRGQLFRGRLEDSKGIIKYLTLEAEGRKYKPYFNLHPPIGGFERKGIKVGFGAGGALGDRKEKINELIRKMI